MLDWVERAVPRDRRTLGQTNTLLECGVDFELRSREIGALLLTDTINIRYVTGVSVMPLWSATNLAHYVLVPAEGSPVVFEYARAKFRPEEFFSNVRKAYHWQARFAEGMPLSAPASGRWRYGLSWPCGVSSIRSSAWTASTTTDSPRYGSRVYG